LLAGTFRGRQCPDQLVRRLRPHGEPRWRAGGNQDQFVERRFMTQARPTDFSSGNRERTILTTDIVGSTALTRRYPNDMMGAMDLHDQILHAAIRRHAGDPFRSTGDGVLASFDRPLDAVLAAIEAQREMRHAKWGPTGRLQVRFGIHTGLTRARGETDFFGPALPTATRLQSAANADQILISDTTVQRLASGLVWTPFKMS